MKDKYLGNRLLNVNCVPKIQIIRHHKRNILDRKVSLCFSTRKSAKGNHNIKYLHAINLHLIKFDIIVKLQPTKQAYKLESVSENFNSHFVKQRTR